MSATQTLPDVSGTGSSGEFGARPSPWIFRPWLDLLVGCGAWSAPLLLLATFASSSHAAGWSFAFYFLALLFNYPHFMATVYRAYHTREDFVKYRIFTLHVALLLALAGVLAHVSANLLPWIFTLYICWSPWHYTGQNFGLAMMFARRAGLSPTPAERRGLQLAFAASFLLLMLSFHTGPSNDPLILSLELPARFTLPARAALGLFFLGSSGWALFSLARRNSVKAILTPLTLTMTQFLWFLLPAAIEIATSREVPQTRYSSGILAVLHSTQYLWITSYYQRREARAAGDASWKMSRYFVTLFAGGIALFIPGPWIVSRVFHTDFAASFLTFTALVNIHHFILDGALWKLRDSRIAALLLDTRDKTANTTAETGGGLLAATRWLGEKSAAARVLRIGAVVLLFGWAALDQAHYYWAHDDGRIASLERAASLNPYDSSIRARIAQAEARTGNSDAAIAALRAAVALRPENLPMQQTLGRMLIEHKRDTEAYALYRELAKKFPRDANSQVNYGLLAAQLGHREEAVDAWQKAIEIDAAQSKGQLYLAQALDARGEAQAAARHYHAYLEIVAAHPAEHRGETGEVLAALVKVADADAEAHRPDEALKGYHAAIGFAEKSGDKAMESLTLVHLAELQEKQGDSAEAARSFQRALAVEDARADPRGAASDWVNYGEFLRRQGQSERLVYACFLRAEELLKTTPSEELLAIAKKRAASETRLGRGASAVRGHLDATIGEAISLSSAAFAAR